MPVEETQLQCFERLLDEDNSCKFDSDQDGSFVPCPTPVFNFDALPTVKTPTLHAAAAKMPEEVTQLQRFERLLDEDNSYKYNFDDDGSYYRP